MKTLSFDYFNNQQKNYIEPKLFALISGIRGAGKSTVIGTLKLKTLLITSVLESHAVSAARIYGNDNVISTFYDIDENNKQLKPDVALNNLHNILDFLIDSPDLLDNIQALSIDSVSAIDKTLMDTSKILLEKNGFESMRIMEQEHFKIIKKLKELHRKGLHILVTMPILSTFDDNGFYLTAKPEIRGVTTTSNIAGIFDDILVVGKIEGNYLFQMDLLITKAGKEVSGAEKSISFHPRISGLSKQDIFKISKESMLLPADLNFIYRLKQAKQKRIEDENI